MPPPTCESQLVPREREREKKKKRNKQSRDGRTVQYARKFGEGEIKEGRGKGGRRASISLDGLMEDANSLAPPLKGKSRCYRYRSIYIHHLQCPLDTDKKKEKEKKEANQQPLGRTPSAIPMR